MLSKLRCHGSNVLLDINVQEDKKKNHNSMNAQSLLLQMYACLQS
jgi:hypothetical protein